MQSENELRFDVTLGTFDHPRYELIATGEIYDGPDEVSSYYEASRRAFPDQRNENVVLSYGEDVVVAEFDLLGTHLGPLRSLPATGRTFRCRMAAFFLFEDDRICCERVYFDQTSILRQLGIAHDPSSLAGRVSMVLNHPLTIGRAVAMGLLGRGAAVR